MAFQALLQWHLDSALLLETARPFAFLLALFCGVDWVLWRWPRLNRPLDWLGQRVDYALGRLPTENFEAWSARAAVALLAFFGLCAGFLSSSRGWFVIFTGLIASAVVASLFWLLMAWMDGLTTGPRSKPKSGWAVFKLMAVLLGVCGAFIALLKWMQDFYG